MPTDGKHQPLQLIFNPDSINDTPETLPGVDEEDYASADGGAGRLARDKVASRVKRQNQFVLDIGVRWYHCDQDGCDYKAKQVQHLKKHKRRKH